MPLSAHAAGVRDALDLHRGPPARTSVPNAVATTIALAASGETPDACVAALHDGVDTPQLASRRETVLDAARVTLKRSCARDVASNGAAATPQPPSG